MLEQFRSIINDLQNKTMVDYMRAGESLPEDEPDAFEGTPFDRISNVKHAGDEELELIISQAEKIVRTAKRNGSIGSDESVYESLALPREYVDPESFYAYKSVSEKGSRRGRTAVNRGSTRTVMSGEAYEIRQKSGETCRG